jgi:WD40 repeat protein
LAGHREAVAGLAFSRDGRLAFTASFDQTARLWDSRLGRPIGPVLLHPDRLETAVFGADGVSLLTACEDGSTRLWRISGPAADLRRLEHLIESQTGLEQNDQGEIRPLETDAWQTHRQTVSRDQRTKR